MTPMFDTETYADDRTHRHLRSIPAAGDSPDTPIRTTQWRLDARTIETGRRGIAAARQALRDAARAGADEPTPTRRRRAA